MKTTKKRSSFLYESKKTSTSNEQRLKDFFVRYEPEILGTLFFLLGSLNEAEETLNEVFLRCWKSNQIDDVKNARVWIFRILHAVVSEKMKKDRIRKRNNYDDVALGDLDESSPEYSFVCYMRKLIYNLDFNERVVFLLRQNGTLSYRQIAQTTGDSIEDVKKAMQVVLDKLCLLFESNKEDMGKSFSNTLSEFSV